ncbi:WhiB family transcriptional regulator [Arthrobacter livingstonensis]|uniref:Transcriptional regulator WhiB n=1 Tax=Arthrobacter livingstonensis TaxID=670078 RepID=A0A2V5LXB8_9MICC|nr:WhiB family transcriptional regulator [Arthrobacter livingstonensis]PYI68407.1 WhiB family transcriptional regulator [Arthrobacter livingstonensis]
MGQAQLSVKNDREGSVQVQAAEQYRLRGVPADWFVDPADPQAAADHEQASRDSLEDAATAFLTAHEIAHESDEQELLAPGAAPEGNTVADPVWIGFRPGLDDFSDEGELGWQTDALCAQTDPEAFFPEKGGSTRDAKKVCGACNVKAQCLEYALANDERFGIWGGLSERERRRLRKRAV